MWLQEEKASLKRKQRRLQKTLDDLEAQLDAFMAEQLEGSSDEDVEDDYEEDDPPADCDEPQ